jgi:TRAP-type uncharacterized transport system substrate-binding protein
MLLALLIITPVACDFTKPQKGFRVAVPKTEYFYNYIVGHFKPFMESKGYHITIVPAASTLEAAQLVAGGQADLTMINNHSTSIAIKLADEAGKLRTIMPLTTRVLFAFSKTPLPDSATAKEIFENKKVGIESLGGETNLTIARFLSASMIKPDSFVTFEDDPDVVVFWDRFYGERANGWEEKGWHHYSFRKNFIDFIRLHDHALRPFKLPAMPGYANSKIVNTLATDVLLVGNRELGENACYLVASEIFQNKVDLIHKDVMYSLIREDFDKETLLFPIHKGTFSYLLRDQPTFFERYAESLALCISLIAVIYSGVQAVQSRIRRNQKERIDAYFLEFLEIRANKMVSDEHAKKLDLLFERALIQMTKEKLDRSDFQILSRLIQQDIMMLRFKD